MAVLDGPHAGKWKLHLRRRALFDLDEDNGEERNVAVDHADIVAQLDALAEECRRDLGDRATGIRGANVRSAGRVSHPNPIVGWDWS